MRAKTLIIIQNETSWLINLGLFAGKCLVQFLMESTELPSSNTTIEEIPGGSAL